MPEMMKAPHSKGADCKMCGGGACRYAGGGEVEDHSPAGGSANRAKSAARMRNEEHVSGVHKSNSVYSPGSSRAGYSARATEGVNARTGQKVGKEAFNHQAKSEHHRVLGEMKSTPGPTSGRSGFAEGGAVGEPDMADESGDEELSHGIGKELIGAFESKDHKKVMSALEAAVLHCMNKSDDEDM